MWGMPRPNHSDFLNKMYERYACTPYWDYENNHRRMIGVDRLTGRVLEARVAVEATRDYWMSEGFLRG